MKQLLIIIVMVAFYGCHEATKPYNESRELIPNPEGYQKDTVIPGTKDSALVSDTLKKQKKTP